MIDLTKHVLQTQIEVDGELHGIKTDFTYWIRFSQLLQEKETPLIALDYLYDGEPPKDRQKGFERLLEFYQPAEPLPNTDDDADGERAVDYVIDGSRIYAAFMQCYGIDLIETPLHWHKFLALFQSLTDTQLNRVIEYRLWEKPTGEKDAYEKGMQRLKDMWALPETDDEREAREKFNERFD